MPDAACIGLITIHEAYRGERLPDGGRLGDFILAESLKLIQQWWGGGPMPPVWAVIDTANDASHSLFERHGFQLIPAAPGSHHDIRLRPRGLSLVSI
jgi:hypothetical protein